MSYSASSISSAKIHVHFRGSECFQHMWAACRAALWQGTPPLSITQAPSSQRLRGRLQKTHKRLIAPRASGTNRVLSTQYANASLSYLKVYTLQKIHHSTMLFPRYLLSKGKISLTIPEIQGHTGRPDGELSLVAHPQERKGPSSKNGSDVARAGNAGKSISSFIKQAAFRIQPHFSKYH